MPEHEPTADVACAEPTLSEELRDALTLLRDRSDDDEFRTLVDEVLAGRCSLFDAATTPAFGTAVFGPVAQEFAQQAGPMTGGPTDAAAAEDSESAALCAALHRQASAGTAGSATSPCAGCARLCAAPCASPPGEA